MCATYGMIPVKYSRSILYKGLIPFQLPAVSFTRSRGLEQSTSPPLKLNLPNFLGLVYLRQQAKTIIFLSTISWLITDRMSKPGKNSFLKFLINYRIFSMAKSGLI
jgi:hypothetical protein